MTWTAPQILWACWTGGVPQAAEQRCRLCGGPAFGAVPYRQVLKAGTPDLGSCGDRDSDVCCAACRWATAGTPSRANPPVRMHSHVWVQGWGALRWSMISQPHPVPVLLAVPWGRPWLAALTSRGQVHVVPWTPLNSGGELWTVRWDSLVVHGSCSAWRRLWAAVAELYAAGYGRDSLEQGRPKAAEVRQAGAEAWLRLWPEVAPHAGGAMHRLACALLRRDRKEEVAREARRIARLGGQGGRGSGGAAQLARLVADGPQELLGPAGVGDAT